MKIIMRETFDPHHIEAHISIVSRQHDVFKLESEISAANKYFIPIDNQNAEIRLLSSLNTLGYIEFDIPCNLNTLKKKLFMNPELPCLARSIFLCYCTIQL